MVQAEAWFYCISGLVLLTLGAERFIDSSVKLSKRLSIPPLLVGLTIVSLGTSAPELFVSVYAALKGSGGMTIGNIIGSNISNLALIGGVAVILRPIQVDARLRNRDLPLLIGVSLIFVIILFDGNIQRFEGGILLVGFFALLWFWIRPELHKDKDEDTLLEHELEAVEEVIEERKLKDNLLVLIGALLIWLICLFLGTRLTVTGAVEIAKYYEVSERLIGLTLVAFGTSLPELAATVAAALKQESEIAIGNLVGSNLSNILLVGGAAGVIAPIGKEGDVATLDLAIMMSVTILFYLLSAFARRGEKEGESRFARKEGVILLISYALYIMFVVGT